MIWNRSSPWHLKLFRSHYGCFVGSLWPREHWLAVICKCGGADFSSCKFVRMWYFSAGTNNRPTVVFVCRTKWHQKRRPLRSSLLIRSLPLFIFSPELLSLSALLWLQHTDARSPLANQTAELRGTNSFADERANDLSAVFPLSLSFCLWITWACKPGLLVKSEAMHLQHIQS